MPTIATKVPRAGFAWVTEKMMREQGVDLPLCATNRVNAPDVAERILFPVPDDPENDEAARQAISKLQGG